MIEHLKSVQMTSAPGARTDVIYFISTITISSNLYTSELATPVALNGSTILDKQHSSGTEGVPGTHGTSKNAAINNDR